MTSCPDLPPPSPSPTAELHLSNASSHPLPKSVKDCPESKYHTPSNRSSPIQPTRILRRRVPHLVFYPQPKPQDLHSSPDNLDSGQSLPYPASLRNEATRTEPSAFRAPRAASPCTLGIFEPRNMRAHITRTSRCEHRTGCPAAPATVRAPLCEHQDGALPHQPGIPQPTQKAKPQPDMLFPKILRQAKPFPKDRRDISRHRKKRLVVKNLRFPHLDDGVPRKPQLVPALSVVAVLPVGMKLIAVVLANQSRLRPAHICVTNPAPPPASHRDGVVEARSGKAEAAQTHGHAQHHGEHRLHRRSRTVLHERYSP